MPKERFRLHYYLEDTQTGRELKAGSEVRLHIRTCSKCPTGFVECGIQSFGNGCLRTTLGEIIPLCVILDFEYI